MPSCRSSPRVRSRRTASTTIRTSRRRSRTSQTRTRRRSQPRSRSTAGWGRPPGRPQPFVSAPVSRVRVLSLSVAAVVVVVAIAYGVALLTSDDTTLAQRLADVAPADTAGATDTSSAIAFWEQRLRENPQAVADRVELGRAYVRLAREEGDLAAYGRAEAVLREAMRLSPPNPRPRALLSSVLIAQHAFTEAREPGPTDCRQSHRPAGTRLARRRRARARQP